MDIKKVTKAYGSENSWTFGKCKSSQQYASRQTYTTKCCLAKGEHNLTCKDSYGDGWHDGYLEINGKKYCGDFSWGKEFLDELSADDLGGSGKPGFYHIKFLFSKLEPDLYLFNIKGSIYASIFVFRALRGHQNADRILWNE